MNKAKLKPSVWLYAIHSNNAELIHLLESNNVPLPKDYNNKDDEQMLIESIKCHHNSITDYFENNFLDQNEKFYQKNKGIIFKYHYYSRFQYDDIIDNSFFYFCFYHYDKFVELLLKMNEKLIERMVRT